MHHSILCLCLQMVHPNPIWCYLIWSHLQRTCLQIRSRILVPGFRTSNIPFLENTIQPTSLQCMYYANQTHLSFPLPFLAWSLKSLELASFISCFISLSLSQIICNCTSFSQISSVLKAHFKIYNAESFGPRSIFSLLYRRSTHMVNSVILKVFLKCWFPCPI